MRCVADVFRSSSRTAIIPGNFAPSLMTRVILTQRGSAISYCSKSAVDVVFEGERMPFTIVIKLEMPRVLQQFRLPKGVDRRLQELLDKQSTAGKLTKAERQEAEGLVNLSEM